MNVIEILESSPLKEVHLKKLIDNKVEESINLDYKSGESLEISDKKKSELAKDISSFANSDGGYIIYGIKEVNHKPVEFTPIDGNIITKEWIEQVIQTRIQRKIPGLLISPIRLNDDITKSIYVVKIPDSSDAPHMTNDKKFYKRYNFESVLMEEYEIRGLYNRKDKTILQFGDIIYDIEAKIENDTSGELVSKNISFQIKNIGKSIEKDYKLIIELNFKNFKINFDVQRNVNNFNTSINENGFRTISFNSVSPIYPGEVLTIGSINFGLLKNSYEELLITNMLKMTLHYSNGVVYKDVKLSDIYK